MNSYIKSWGLKHRTTALFIQIISIWTDNNYTKDTKNNKDTYNNDYHKNTENNENNKNNKNNKNNENNENNENENHFEHFALLSLPQSAVCNRMSSCFKYA